MAPTLLFEILRFKLSRLLPSLRATFAASNQMRKEGRVDFIKFTGTGSNEYGFSILPDLRQYVVFSIWSDALEVKRYVNGGGIVGASKIDSGYERFAVSPTSAKGFWDGYALDLGKACQDPSAAFSAATLTGSKINAAGGSPIDLKEKSNLLRGGDNIANDGGIVVLTRASIRWQRLLRFWQAVPSVTRSLSGSDGLIRSIGFGEYPLIRQATFSIWESRRSMIAFAYGGRHQEIIKRTHAERWYREEMFVEGRLMSDMCLSDSI